MTQPLWTPSAEFTASTRYAAYLRHLADGGRRFADYREVWAWSVDDLPGFWTSIRDFFGLDISTPERVVDEHASMPGVDWFTGATTNYAANVLAQRRPGVAIKSLDETGATGELSWDELCLRVGALARWFRDHGVKQGDRVVAYVPNIPAAVVGLLAAASVGAVWASCAEEFSADGGRDRFAQLAPKILIAADGYHYGGKWYDRRSEAETLARQLGATLLWVSELEAIAADGCAPEFTRVDFSHPLWVLFSSGTTGRPKGIVHGHGGILLEHAKLLALHTDIRPDSTYLWFATPSWMMWNAQLSGLLCGATICTYDGSPVFPDAAQGWRIAETLGVDMLGTSAAALIAAQKLGTHPLEAAPGLRLRMLGSTGSPLPPSTAEWVAAVLPESWLVSISGGTDVCSAFMGGVPGESVYAGEIQGPALGCAMAAWDADGTPVVGATGELVITRPMPSMPVFFWDDADFAKYRGAYFDRFDGVWRHGDWVTVAERGGVVVHGRSDATMNRHGVRIGSGEIYEVVDQLDGVAESLVVGVELDDGGYWMPLFVVPAAPDEPDALARRIRDAVRTRVSPRHVPDEVIFVEALPHTRTGKKLEVPAKRILQGADPATVVNANSVDNPDALARFALFRR